MQRTTVRYSFSTLLMRPALGAWLVGGLLALAGCKSATPQTPEQQLQSLRDSYQQRVGEVISEDARRSNLDDWVGGVSLRVLISPLNQVLACTVEALPEYPLEDFPGNRKLLPLVEQACWDGVFPRAESRLFGSLPAANLQVVVPLVFPRAKPRLMHEQRVRETVREYYGQETYFWQQVFAVENLDSIGRASIRGTANAQGQVQRCQVQLAAIALRQVDFKQDPNLVQRLEARCASLDLRQMPGFFIEEPVGGRFLVELDYTPWKGGPKQP